MNQHPHSPEEAPSASVTPGPKAKGLDRRRLLKIGAGASPVLLSLGSKPAMAGQLPCGHHQSGWASAGSRSTVNNGDHSTHGSGCTPAYWCKAGVTWPCSKSTSYSSCMGSAPDVCTDTLWAAMNCSDELVRHFAAAYVNCKAGKYGSKTIVTEANLKLWWPACKANSEVTINGDGRIRKSSAYWKSSTALASPDSRAGGFLNLLKSINTIN